MNTSLNKVLITDPIDKSCIEILESNGIPVVYKPKLPVQDILEEIKDADALIVRSGTTVTAEIIEAAKKLKIIGRAGVGVDNIDCDAATRNGVVVINSPGGNTLSAAEHTCAIIMSLARQIPQACQTLKSEKWDRAKFMGNELYGKTLAIVGLGRIGREVAHRMQSFGMTTIGFDPLVPAEESSKFGVEWLSLEEIWPRADYVTLHVPLIPQTKNMVNKDVLNRCKKGVKFVNVARGGIIDDAAIYEALDSGQCGGLGVDVFLEEPPKDFTLIKHPMVVCTPHLGASTQEGQIKVAQEIANQFLDFVKGKPLHGAVNAVAFNDSLNEEWAPWTKLANALGKLARNLLPSENIKESHLTVSIGKSMGKLKNLLLSSTLTGFLETSMDKVNFINASALASSAGIQVQVELKDTDVSEPSISVEIAQNTDRHIITGSVNGKWPLLTAVDSETIGYGIPLKGFIALFKGCPKGCLGSIIDNITAKGIAVKFASESNSSKWYVIGLSDKLTLDKGTSVEKCTFMAQIHV